MSIITTNMRPLENIPTTGQLLLVLVAIEPLVRLPSVKRTSCAPIVIVSIHISRCNTNDVATCIHDQFKFEL